MSVRLPGGVRDQLPLAAARRQGVVGAILGECARWGYRPVAVPLFEYDEVLRRGTGGPARALRLVEPSTGEVLALRPDMTPQVARLVATRLHDEPGPLRLLYQGSVVRLPPAGAPIPDGGELFQVGVELIDAPQPGGDLEIVALAVAALEAAGVGGLVVDLAHAELAHAVLSHLGLDEADGAALQAALAKKDQARVEAVMQKVDTSERHRALCAALPLLHGQADVLQTARRLLEGPPVPGERMDVAAALGALDELEALVARLGALGGPGYTLDLGEVRGLGYYTGLRFQIYADGAGGALASGGRYDHLVERYGRAARATGFAVDVDRVSDLLRARGAEVPEPSGGILVGGDLVLAARLARRLRTAGQRTILDLDDPPPPEAVLRARAARQRLGRVVVIEAQQLVWYDVAPAEVRGSLTGAALERLLQSEGTVGLDVIVPPE